MLFLVTIISLSFLGCKALLSSLAFLSSGPFVWVLSSSILRIVPSILQGGQSKYLSLWWDSSGRSWFREVFSFVADTLFLFFLSSLLVWLCPLPTPPSTCMFPFLRAFWFFLYLQFYSFCCLSFVTFYYKHGTVFYAKFHSYILTAYPYCLY